MRISDWSSDVCSSDLQPDRVAGHDGGGADPVEPRGLWPRATRIFRPPGGFRDRAARYRGARTRGDHRAAPEDQPRHDEQQLPRDDHAQPDGAVGRDHDYTKIPSDRINRTDIINH